MTKKVSNTQSKVTERPPREPSIIQIPGEFFPHANFKNALWIRMTARELTGMHTGGRGGSLQIGKKGTTFKFLAPSQIIDTHNHTWEEYASIQSRILQKVISFSTAADQFGSIKDNLKTAFKNSKGWPSGQQLINILMKTGDVNVPKFKIDTPLAYKSSGRRQYQLTFQLADSRGGEIIKHAVELLQEYAAPEARSEIDIQFPFVFTVVSEPEGLINMKYAALESVLVTWMDPYIKGRPSRAELTLSLKDMSPLFKKTITEGGIVNVNTKAREPQTDSERIDQARNHPNVGKRAIRDIEGQIY